HAGAGASSRRTRSRCEQVSRRGALCVDCAPLPGTFNASAHDGSRSASRGARPNTDSLNDFLAISIPSLLRKQIPRQDSAQSTYFRPRGHAQFSGFHARTARWIARDTTEARYNRDAATRELQFLKRDQKEAHGRGDRTAATIPW